MTIRYDDSDTQTTPDGLKYTLKPWNVRAFGFVGAGFVDDNGTYLCCTRGEYPDSNYQPMFVIYEKIN